MFFFSYSCIILISIKQIQSQQKKEKKGINKVRKGSYNISSLEQIQKIYIKMYAKNYRPSTRFGLSHSGISPKRILGVQCVANRIPIKSDIKERSISNAAKTKQQNSDNKLKAARVPQEPKQLPKNRVTNEKEGNNLSLKRSKSKGSKNNIQQQSNKSCLNDIPLSVSGMDRNLEGSPVGQEQRVLNFVQNSAIQNSQNTDPNKSLIHNGSFTPLQNSLSTISFNPAKNTETQLNRNKSSLNFDQQQERHDISKGYISSDYLSKEIANHCLTPKQDFHQQVSSPTKTAVVYLCPKEHGFYNNFSTKQTMSQQGIQSNRTSQGVMFEKMGERKRGIIYEEWDNQQTISKWENKPAEPHKLIERATIESVNSNLFVREQRSISRNSSQRQRDFVSQIQTLPGGFTKRQLREKTLTPEPKKIHPLNILIQQSYLQQLALREKKIPSYNNKQFIEDNGASRIEGNISMKNEFQRSREEEGNDYSQERKNKSIQEADKKDANYSSSTILPQYQRQENTSNLFARQLEKQQQSKINKTNKQSENEDLYQSAYKQQFLMRTSEKDVLKQEEQIQKKNEEVAKRKQLSANGSRSPNAKIIALNGNSSINSFTFAERNNRTMNQDSSPLSTKNKINFQDGKKEEINCTNHKENLFKSREDVQTQKIWQHVNYAQSKELYAINAQNLGIYQSYEKKDNIQLRTAKKQHPMNDFNYRTSYNFLSNQQ